MIYTRFRGAEPFIKHYKKTRWFGARKLLLRVRLCSKKGHPIEEIGYGQQHEGIKFHNILFEKGCC